LLTFHYLFKDKEIQLAVVKVLFSKNNTWMCNR